LLILILANILFYTKDGEFVNLISPINTTDMINDITNFEIINERDGTIVDNSLVLSSDDVLIQVNY